MEMIGIKSKNAEYEELKHLNKLMDKDILVSSGHKRCSRCGVIKPYSEFYWHKKNQKYLNPCNVCRIKYGKERHKKKQYNSWFEKNKETMKEYEKERYIKNKDSKKEYYKNNQDRIIQRNKEYRLKNKEKIALKRKEKYEAKKKR